MLYITFWVYSDAITDFQVLGQYFPFSKKILSVFRSSSAVSGLGPIHMLYICFNTCFTYSDISFLVFLTFWVYSDAITDFQVLGQYFPFCKKILSVFRSSSAVSGLGPIHMLYICFNTCFTYSDISFLVFLTFWVYSDAITDFQVLGQYFPFCTKILSVFRSSSAVSGLGPIEKLYLLKKAYNRCVRPWFAIIIKKQNRNQRNKKQR